VNAEPLSWPKWLSRRVILSYAVAAALTWLFLRHAEWQILLESLRSVAWPLVAAAIVVRLVSLIVASLRWQVLLAPVQQVPLRPIVVAMMMGMAVSALVSMQAAEIARPYLLSRRASLRFSAAVATVAVEWFFDILAVLVLFIPVQSLWIAAPQAGRWGMNVAITLLAIVSVASLAVMRWAPHGLKLVREWVQGSGIGSPSLRERMVNHLEQFSVGLRILERPKGMAMVAAYSLLTSFLTAVSVWLALLAFGLPVTFLSGFLVLGMVTIGGMTPTPGAVGGFHAVCQLGLMALLKLDTAQTVGPVIGLHAVLYIPSAAIGSLCFLSTRVERQRAPA
jgi:uncharacterized protein (TIRG00374 family)